MRSTEKYVHYDGPLGRCAVEFYRGDAYIHLKMKQGSIDAMREVRSMCGPLVDLLRRVGANRVYAYNRVGEEVWCRFMRNLGFRGARRENGWQFMEACNA